MRDVKVTGAEYHIGETELHLPISGSARMWVDGEEKEIIPGQVIAVEPETPHFIIPNKDYVVAVVSLPSFNPENLIPIEAETQLPENMKFDTKYHLGLVAAAGWSKSESE
jgi:mannose-6-phosphate isomerase-like protein (cupin superfamily)